MRVRAPTSIAIALLACGCSYDLERLRGRDGSVLDAAPDDRFDDTATDAPDGLDAFDGSMLDGADDAFDAPSDGPVDTRTDGLLDGPSLICTTRSAPSVTDVGTTVGGTVRVTGDTTGEPSLLSPPSNGGCTGSSSAAPEKVYRYVVQSGSRLYANTDAATCAGVFDTVLYARTTCDEATGVPLACNDDDHVLMACSGDARYGSGILLDGLTPGRTLFLVVDGYGGNAGPFRLNVTENGLANAPPSTDSSLNPATACSCPGSLDNRQQAVGFPATGDMMRSASGTFVSSLNRAGDRISGAHGITFVSVGGAALEFTLAANMLCQGGSLTMDLLINGRAVGAFVVDSAAPTGVPLRMALQTFGSITAPANNTPLELRVRGVSNNACGTLPGLRFDLTMPGTLTLLGHP